MGILILFLLRYLKTYNSYKKSLLGLRKGRFIGVNGRVTFHSGLVPVCRFGPTAQCMKASGTTIKQMESDD